ncbi:hypothetical protein [Cesiribacter sp. SM1]|uniref:hypothetical protein n=1 Tax=Cesiribacter sp. SM1 TaxID=2861196 RepID=UPI001CD69DF1|nr:hypothetical protein [Cesiribacter sp. SM1]
MKRIVFSSMLMACLLPGLFSCNSTKETHSTNATLRWTGMLAADGCGYFLDIDGKEYKPSNEEVIPDSFQEQEVQQVQLTYEILEEPQEYTCGMMPTRYSSSIKIIEISPL